MYLIGLTGVSGVGKTTLAKHIALEEGFVHCSFSLPLRALVYHMYRLDITKWGDKTYEHTTLTRGEGQGATPQQLLIREGWWCRAHDPWVFVRYVAELVRDYRVQDYPGMVFDDARQANEALFIRNLGGTVMELRRPNIERAPQALDDNLTLLGGEVVYLDLDPHKALANKHTTFCTDYLDTVGPSTVLCDGAEELMHSQFESMNTHLI